MDWTVVDFWKMELLGRRVPNFENLVGSLGENKRDVLFFKQTNKAFEQLGKMQPEGLRMDTVGCLAKNSKKDCVFP